MGIKFLLAFYSMALLLTFDVLGNGLMNIILEFGTF
jgi:hypothetical protein